MQRRLFFTPIEVALLLAATCVAADPPVAAEPKFEYKVVDLGQSGLFRSLEKEADRKGIVRMMNKFGLDSWEPIAVVAQPNPPSPSGGGATDSYPRWCYYKRPRADGERKKWEYKLVDLPLHFPRHSKADGTTEKRVTEALATFAEEGWEIATVISGWCESEWWKPGAEGPRFYVLKRAK